jgi:lon-related putative ATP-dependent protease
MSDNSFREPLPPEALHLEIPASAIKAESSNELPPLRGIIGQDRAMRALELGLRIQAPGYNLFVCGVEGTGRSTVVRTLLARFARERPAPKDKCYVHNFQDPDRPRLLLLPPGTGRRFAADMERLVRRFTKALNLALKERRFRNRRNEVLKKYQQAEYRAIRSFEKQARESGFVVVETNDQNAPKADIMPIFDGVPRSFEELEELHSQGRAPRAQIEQFQLLYPELRQRLDDTLQEVNQIHRELDDALQRLEVKTLRPRLRTEIARLKTRYEDPAIREHLEQVERELLRSIDHFKHAEEQQADGAQPYYDHTRRFMVNVLVDNSGRRSAPLIFENVPSYKNLFGTIDKAFDPMGQVISDFLDIKPGSLVEADGGFLALNLVDAVTERGVWKHLKRTLKNGQLEIEAPEGAFPGSGSALKPMPIPIDVKVVLIGDRQLYDTLQRTDEDFRKIFKIKAEFEDTVRFSRRHVNQYAKFIAALCKRESLLPFNREAMAAVIEQAIRYAGWRKRISTQMGRIADLVREAAFWAAEEGAAIVDAAHVQRAHTEQIRRLQLDEDLLQEAIEENYLLIDTGGARVGVVNGLAVYESGDYLFGRPCRITATTAVGRTGIINVERESRLSDPTHTKAVLILSGFLRHVFGQRSPFCLDATLCFEQSYSWIEGDSASLAEGVALISSLAGAPVRQDLAVTGSLNQFGVVQSVGAISEKIEGFYQVCRARGLTGSQGVIIPRTNVQNLLLDPDLVADAAAGKFAIYAVDHVSQAIELLTGMPAGKPDAKGNYPPDTVFGRAARRVRELARLARRRPRRAHRKPRA